MKARLAGLALLCLAAACGSDSSGPSNNANTVAYSGTFAGGTHSGTIRFTSEGAPATVTGAALVAPTNLIGSLVFSDGSVLYLSGTLDGAALLLTAPGYSFTGTLSGGIISGTFTGPAGESGNFSAALDTSANVVLYCGTYSGTDGGVFSLALNPDRTGGVIVVPTGSSGGLTGKARPKSGTTDQVEVLPDAAPTFVIATGTIALIGPGPFDTISGPWNDGSGGSGTFGGSTRCN
jgi:hypothetical protein